MIKTLAAANKSEREHFKIPRSVQQSIPIQRIYRDGIWMVNGKYSRTWRFADINYSVWKLLVTCRRRAVIAADAVS